MIKNCFTTERLLFRSFEVDDLDRLAAISADPIGSRYVGDGEPLDRASTELWILNSRDNVEKHGYGTGAVVEKSSGILIGWAGVARPGDGTEEIIYGLDRDYWGQGFGIELLTGIIAWAAECLTLDELRATVDKSNLASTRMLIHQGFELRDDAYEGEAETHLYIRRFSG